MLKIAIPEFGELGLAHLILDFNGTLARDGTLLPEVRDGLEALAADLAIHVLTADTFGTARRALAGMPCTVAVLGEVDQARAKRDIVRDLGADRAVAIGNGRNDRLMLEEAALGIAVVLAEGAASATVQAADVVCTSIGDALGLLAHPKRLIATLRS